MEGVFKAGGGRQKGLHKGWRHTLDGVRRAFILIRILLVRQQRAFVAGLSSCVYYQKGPKISPPAAGETPDPILYQVKR